MNRQVKKATTIKLTKARTESQDGAFFMKNQMRQEKEMSEKLSLGSKTQEKLQTRHSVSAISRLFDRNAKVIAKQHYLYELPPCGDSVSFATFRPIWCESEKSVETLDCYSYCLFTRKEYKAALANDIPKDAFTNLKQHKDSRKAISKKEKPKSHKLKDSVHPTFISIEDDVDDGTFVDVLNDRCEDVTPSKQADVVFTPIINIVEQEKKAQPLEDVIVEKEPVVIPHIENILNFNGVCDEQPHILTILPSPSKQQQPDAKDERRLKRHRSERRREGDDDDESDDEDLRKKIARLNHHNQLEREYRDLQEQLNSERLKLMERRLDTLTKSVQESNQENQYLRRALNQQQRANNNNGFLQQQKAEPPKRRRVAQPKARKMHQQAPIHAQEPQQQQSLDQFMLVPYQGPQQQEQMTVEQQVIPMPVIDITETAEFIAQQNEFIARCEAEETQAINLLMPFTEQGVTNIGVQFMHRYKLSGYLELLLQAMRDPTRNHHINEILEHPFMKNYKITLVPNISLAAQPFTSQIESNRQMLLQSNQALNKQSLEVRRNISMVNVHCWFLSKAIRYEDMADAGQLAYKPMLMSQFPHFYDAEICRAWYPYVDSGNNCIITPDLKIPARSIQHGQGHGKHCCFCDFQYIANSEGRLKFAHQVKNCDFIAEMSYDERVILSVVLEKRHSSAEFNKHPFIAKYNPQSLLRRATAEEISQGKFLPFKGDKLRINMATLLSMRQRAYGRFLARVESLDIHDANTEDKLKNLDAKPIAHQLDCFYLTSTPPQPNNVAAADGNKKAASRAKKQTKPGSVQSDRIKKTDGFLYKTLLDYDGNQFRKSKFDEADKTLRDFTLNESTGFGDGMYFSCMYDPLPDRYPTANALPFTVPPIAQQVNDYLASQQQQQFFLPPPQLMLEQYEQQQQQATEVEEQGMEIVFNNEIPSPIAMPTPSPIIIDIATSTTTTTTFMHDHFGARTNEDYGEEDNNDIWGNAKQKEPSIFGSFEIEDSGVIDINAMFTRRDQVFGDPYSFDSDNSSFSKNKTFSSFGDYF